MVKEDRSAEDPLLMITCNLAVSGLLSVLFPKSAADISLYRPIEIWPLLHVC